MHWVAGLLALAAATASAGTPATGGVRLLEAMESAGRVVVGRVDGVERLDTHGYAATLTIETVVGASSGRVDTTLPLRIAWEELSSARPPRPAPSGCPPAAPRGEPFGDWNSIRPSTLVQ